MGKFEKENISKKVNGVSYVFAALASLGILIIGLQLFSKTTGYDIFDINYSLSKLFSNDNSKVTNSPKLENSYQITDSPYQSIITEKAESNHIIDNFLNNHVVIPAIKPSSTLLEDQDQQNSTKNKFTELNINTLRRTQDFFKLNFENYQARNRNQNGILFQVKEPKISRWSLGIGITPSLNYRKLQYKDVPTVPTSGFHQTESERNTTDKASMKYALSVDLIYRINTKLSLQSGITYYNTGEALLIKELAEASNPSSYRNSFFEGSPDFESPSDHNAENNIRFANNLSYWEIPLIANYKLKTITDFTDLELQIGASLTRLDYANCMVYNFDNNGYYLVTGKSPEIYKTYGSNLITGFVYNKFITSRIQLFANPQVKVGLTNIFNSNYQIKQHNYSAGVRLGMKINL